MNSRGSGSVEHGYAATQGYTPQRLVKKLLLQIETYRFEERSLSHSIANGYINPKHPKYH